MLKKTYHDTGENQLSAEHIEGRASISLCQHMDQIRPKTGNPMDNFFHTFYKYYVLLMFQTNSIMAQKNINYLHNTKEGLTNVSWKNIVSDHGADTA